MPSEGSPLLSRPAEEGEEAPLSKNVPRIIAYQLVDGICFSIWQPTVLQLLLYRLGGNSYVGWISGVAGVAQLLAAVASSRVADKKSRVVVTRAASAFGCIASATSIVAVLFDITWLFYLSSVFWGFYMGSSNPSVEAMFGDSVPSGRRAKIYNIKWMVQIISYLFGYVMNLILFWRLGNDWSTEDIKIVLYSGFGAHFASFMMLLSAHDKYSLKATTDDSEEKKEKGKKSEADVTVSEKFAALYPEAEERNEKRCLRWGAIPYLITSGDVLMSLGSGMTLRFFPLFFINDYDVSPVAFMGVLCIISIVTTLVAAITRQAADRFAGRVPSVLVTRLMGTGGLLYLAIIHGPGAAVIPMLAVFVIRNALMNSAMGITRSVIMDFVGKASRARWSAMESVATFTWSGSAVVGGYIADAHGYRRTFLVTVAFHATSCLMLFVAATVIGEVERFVMSETKKKKLKEKQKAEGVNDDNAEEEESAAGAIQADD